MKNSRYKIEEIQYLDGSCRFFPMQNHGLQWDYFYQVNGGRVPLSYCSKKDAEVFLHRRIVVGVKEHIFKVKTG